MDNGKEFENNEKSFIPLRYRISPAYTHQTRILTFPKNYCTRALNTHSVNKRHLITKQN